MGKFKIGARVRDEDGDEGVIVGKSKGHRDVRYETGIAAGLVVTDLAKSYLTPIPDNDNEPVAPEQEEWQPKVGDRVRMLRDGFSTTGATGKLATIEAYSGGDLTNDGQYLLNIDGPVDYGTVAFTPEYTRTKLEWIEPVAAEAQGAGGKASVSDILDELEAWFGDAIPVAVAPATATPAVTAGKFKVGDRVRVRGSSSPDIYTVATRNSFGNMSLQFPWKDGPGLEWWSDDELEPADTPVSAGAIRIGQFANLRVKVTGIDRQHANVIIPGQRFPSHAVPLSALSA